MSTRTLASFGVSFGAFLLATLFAGWWAVPIVGALLGVIAPVRRPAALAALAAACAWGALLVIAALRGPVGTMAVQLGAVLRVPGLGLYLVTMLFAAGLAWSAAAVASRSRRPRRGGVAAGEAVSG